METEYRSITDFGPARLFRKDLEELEQLVVDSRSHPNDSFEVELIFDDKTCRADSLNKLLQQVGLPEKCNKLVLNRKGWKEQEGENVIDRSLWLTMYPNFISCQVASTDEDWFRGKLSRLKRFFGQKRPWYSGLHKLIPYYSLAALLFFAYSATLIASRNFGLATIPALSGVALIYLAVQGSRGKLFPFFELRLIDRKKSQFGLNEIAVSLGALASLATILQFFWGLVK